MILPNCKTCDNWRVFLKDYACVANWPTWLDDDGEPHPQVGCEYEEFRLKEEE